VIGPANEGQRKGEGRWAKKGRGGYVDEYILCLTEARVVCQGVSRAGGKKEVRARGTDVLYAQCRRNQERVVAGGVFRKPGSNDARPRDPSSRLGRTTSAEIP